MTVGAIQNQSLVGVTGAAAAKGPSDLSGLSAGVLKYQDAIEQASHESGVPARLIASVMQTESGGCDAVINGVKTSCVGAIGAMQLMPATAAALHVDPRVPEDNIRGGAKYLATLLKSYGGDVNRAVRAYNAGPGNENSGRAATFKETAAYEKKVMGLYSGETVVAVKGGPDVNSTEARKARIPGTPGLHLPGIFAKLQNLFAFAEPTTMETVMTSMRQVNSDIYPDSISDKQLQDAILDQNREQLDLQRSDLSRGIYVFKAGAELRAPDLQVPPGSFHAYKAPEYNLTPSATVATAAPKADPTLKVYRPPTAA